MEVRIELSGLQLGSAESKDSRFADDWLVLTVFFSFLFA